MSAELDIFSKNHGISRRKSEFKKQNKTKRCKPKNIKNRKREKKKREKAE